MSRTFYVVVDFFLLAFLFYTMVYINHEIKTKTKILPILLKHKTKRFVV